MFALTLVDHLRLTFGHVIYAHRAHSQLAWRHTRFNRWLLGGEALLMVGAVVCAFALVYTGQLPYAIATAATTVAALCTLIVRLMLDFDRSAAAHRAIGARLWHIREQYRALLADLKDETLTLERARERRDALMQMLHDVYEAAPPADRAIYEAARNALPGAHEGVLSDEEIDKFLPRTLQHTGKPAA